MSRLCVDAEYKREELGRKLSMMAKESQTYTGQSQLMNQEIHKLKKELQSIGETHQRRIRELQELHDDHVANLLQQRQQAIDEHRTALVRRAMLAEGEVKQLQETIKTMEDQLDAFVTLQTQRQTSRSDGWTNTDIDWDTCMAQVQALTQENNVLGEELLKYKLTIKDLKGALEVYEEKESQLLKDRDEYMQRYDQERAESSLSLEQAQHALLLHKQQMVRLESVIEQQKKHIVELNASIDELIAAEATIQHAVEHTLAENQRLTKELSLITNASDDRV